MSVIFIDRIANVVMSNGVMRIDCVTAGPNNQELPSGTLLIPANQVGPFVHTLVTSTQQIGQKIQESMGQAKQGAEARPPESP
jgi:hypothetical protein